MLRRCQEGVRLVLRKCHKKRSGNCLRNFKEEYKKCQGRIEKVSRKCLKRVIYVGRNCKGSAKKDF